jgi:hypothetical protein
MIESHVGCVIPYITLMHSQLLTSLFGHITIRKPNRLIRRQCNAQWWDFTIQKQYIDCA